MAFRGWFALDGVEIANSTRVSTHLGREVPTNDLGMFGTAPGGEGSPCQLVEVQPNLFEIPPECEEVYPGLWTPPNGARRYGPSLYEMDGTCWGSSTVCDNCVAPEVLYDDSWPGLRSFLQDIEYRPELAPWYTTELPESGEFAGVWVMKVDGLGPTPVERPVQQAVGNGAVAAPNRDMGRTVTFEALLIGCTHAGVEYGLDWLACLLRATTPDTRSSLRFLQASPMYSAVDPESLVRELHSVVLTRSPTVVEEFNTESRQHQQATIYRVSWEMNTLSPYSYLPAVEMVVDWDEITQQPINYVHAAECQKPESCDDMPVLFSATCVPEEITLRTAPPPVCGGCMPVGALSRFSYMVPTMDRPFRCRETAVTTTIENTSDADLTLIAYWRECGADVRCEDDFWPLQVNALPPGAQLILDGVTGEYWAKHDDRIKRPVGIVGTPNGAPWRPPLIDRRTCWNFIVQTASTADFEVYFTMADRAA